MAFIPVANTVAVETIFELDGQIVENTSYWEAVDVTPTLTEVQTLLDTIRGVVEEDLLPLLADAIKLVRLVGTLLTAVDSLSTTLNISPAVSGGVGGPFYPNNVSYTVSFLTSARGRSFRGRNYIAGLPVDAVSGNTVDSDFRTGLLAYYTGLRAEMSELGWQMVVVSRYANHAPRVAGVTTPIDSFTTFDATVDSQRRRLPGRGN